jgi:branched-chain amino acid transport system substrate-binding protein
MVRIHFTEEGTMKLRLASIGIAVAALCSLSLSAQAADHLKIGYLSTLSGPAGALGVEIRDGFILARQLAGG